MVLAQTLAYLFAIICEMESWNWIIACWLKSTNNEILVRLIMLYNILKGNKSWSPHKEVVVKVNRSELYYKFKWKCCTRLYLIVMFSAFLKSYYICC